MFTGLVEEIGTVKHIQKSGALYQMAIGANHITEDLSLGDSIAVNGLCLTACQRLPGGFVADVMPESLSRSSLGQLKPGSPVNLERAMQANGRFGGHMVSGHIDGVGHISHIEEDGNAIWYTVTTGPDILTFTVEKGSIAIDGVSLTIAYVDKSCFKVSIIPHTARATILSTYTPGHEVNLECDMVGKYVYQFLNKASGQSPPSKIDNDFLAKHGFY